MQKSFILLVLILILAVQAAHYYPLLPDQLASNFDLSGQANGYSSKSSFYLILFSTTAFTLLLLVGSAYLLHLIPPSMINIPHRDHWLAEERKDETFRKVRSMMVDISAATTILFMAMFQLTVNANLGDQGLGSSSILVLVLYLGYTAWWVFRLYREFRVVPPA